MTNVIVDQVDGGELQMFFSDKTMQTYLARARDRISSFGERDGKLSDPTEAKRVALFIRASLDEMINMPAVFDSSCGFNIKHIGSKFIESVQGVGTSENHEVETLFACCYRFIVEFELKSAGGMSQNLTMFWNDISEFDFLEFTTASKQIRWAKNHMVINIMREYINHPHMTKLKDLPAAIQISEEARLKSNEDLSDREARVNALQDKLKGYENAYNFVGLYQGFSTLRGEKIKEREATFKFLCFLGVCLVLVPLLKLFGVVGHEEDIVRESLSIAALFALELMVVYFFRITLQNFKSIKAQLLQIDLRMTLCQFINSYVEFASEARKGDKELLTRFEQVIFSGIVNDDSGIPSTFDGLEHVAKIVGSLKTR